MITTRKLDRISPPASTILSLAICTIAGAVLAAFVQWEIGISVTVGAYIAIILKKAAEISDRAVWQAITGKLDPKE